MCERESENFSNRVTFCSFTLITEIVFALSLPLFNFGLLKITFCELTEIEICVRWRHCELTMMPTLRYIHQSPMTYNCRAPSHVFKRNSQQIFFITRANCDVISVCARVRVRFKCVSCVHNICTCLSL